MRLSLWVAVVVLVFLSSVALAIVPDPVDSGALRAAIEDLGATFPGEYPNLESCRARIASWETEWSAIEEGLKSSDPSVRTSAEEKMEEVRSFQREVLRANPLARRPIVFVVRPQYKPDHHNTETMFQTGEINTASFAGGGALKVLDPVSGASRTLLDAPDGIIRDPEVHFDGGRIVFSMRRNIEDDYHIYEINADGTGLKQLTFVKGVSDIDPVYLPDDSIAFSSTREPKYCMCNRHIMANLFRMEADGANIHQIGKSTLFEGHGSLMPDGRILYSRWEYVDRNFGDAQGLWTVFPDGTNHAVYWGNNTPSPGAVLDAKVLPDGQRVLCVFGSCHDRPWGALAIVDRRLALDGRNAVVRTWPADAVNLVTAENPTQFDFDTFKRVKPMYEDPYPLNHNYFLCARMTGDGEQMGLYLVDVFGNEVLMHVEGAGCYDPMPLAPRTRPASIPQRRDFEQPTGYFYVADVYRGTHMEGVARGSVKYLRVVESPEKRFWTDSPWNGQGQEAPAMNWHDFNNKRILGTVPVEEDGSAYFAVPAEKFVYFQLLDEKGMMIQSMRSGTIVQPGERQGCVGCHEDRRTAAPVPSIPRLKALTRPPDELNGWHGAPRLFSYMEEVQPVFDRNCVSCHDYGKKAGDKLNLSADRDLVFNTSYNELWKKGLIKAIGAGPAQTQPAYSWGSHASRIAKVIGEKHRGVKLDPESYDRIVTWIDINAPYYPSYASSYPGNLSGRSPLNPGQVGRLAELTGIPFADQAGFSANPGPMVCFERPEMSACLGKLDKADPKYAEALTIIQAGREMLSKTPRPDMAGFVACEKDGQREAKYVLRQKEENRSREAIRTGQRAYDVADAQ